MYGFAAYSELTGGDSRVSLFELIRLSEGLMHKRIVRAIIMVVEIYSLALVFQGS